jgi:large subunit ribosomal protein L31
MKQGIHPDYHPVVFRDRSADFAFLTRSTATSDRTIQWEDGNTYPVIDVEISAASHPFYTGNTRVVDTAGRVERFNRRYAGKVRRADRGDHLSGARSPQGGGLGGEDVEDDPYRGLAVAAAAANGEHLPGNRLRRRKKPHPRGDPRCGQPRHERHPGTCRD